MGATKRCPYCGEEILAVAKKCRYCGEWLDGRNNVPPPKPVSSPKSAPKEESDTVINDHAAEAKKAKEARKAEEARKVDEAKKAEEVRKEAESKEAAESKKRQTAEKKDDYKDLDASILEREEIDKTIESKKNVLGKASKELKSISPESLFYGDHEPYEWRYNVKKLLKWSLITLPIVPVSLILILCYKRQKRLWKEAVYDYHVKKYRRGELEHFIRSCQFDIDSLNGYRKQKLSIELRSCIPLPKDAITDDNYLAYSGKIRHIAELKRRLAATDDETQRDKIYLDLINYNLCLFYELSIKAESSRAYDPFMAQLNVAKTYGNWHLLRSGQDNVDEEYQNYLTPLPDRLRSDLMSPVREKLQRYRQAETTGLLGMRSAGKLNELIGGLRILYEEAKSAYDSIPTERINYILEYTRLNAYRNTYLAVELINYIRDNAGGGSLTTEKGDVQSINFDGILNTAANVKSKQNYTADPLVEFIRSDFGRAVAVKLTRDLPLVAAGAAVIGGIDALIGKRIDKLDSLEKTRDALIGGISEMTEAYLTTKAAAIRAIEMIMAIAKANEGFMAVYSPLKQKVFIKREPGSVTMAELQKLVLATNEYNKIASSKL